MDPIELFDHFLIFKDSVLSTGDNNLNITVDDSFLEHIISELSEALKGRAANVSRIDVPISSDNHLTAVGFRVTDQNSHSVLTRGPISGSEAGNTFQSFWNPRSELRRIDGDIYECVIWSSNENVWQQIIDFVLHNKFGLPKQSYMHRQWIQITPNRLNPLLVLHQTLPSGAMSANSIRLVRAMDNLRSILRSLSDKLPLNINGVLPLSSSFRDTAVFPPTLHYPATSSAQGRDKGRQKRKLTDSSVNSTCTLSSPYFPQYVIISLEMSGKWPDELDAFTQMKRLLIIRMHEVLSPLGIPSHPTENNMLDIFLDGLVFRVAIAQPFEHTLLKNARQPDTTSQGSGPAPVNPTAASDWARFYQSLPQLCGILSGVARNHAHVFPIACRLAKRWLSSHGFPVVLCPYEAENDGVDLLDFTEVELTTDPTSNKTRRRFVRYADKSNCIGENNGRMSELAVELLVLYAAGFAGPMLHSTESLQSKVAPVKSAAPWHLPTGSPVTAFLRFLNLLSSHNWEQKPLLIDLNEGFEDIAKIRTALNSFETDRNRLPAMVLCTPLDPVGSEWTSIGPTPQGLAELQRLAAESRRLLRAMLIAGAKLEDLKMVFRPSNRNLDVLLQLKPDICRVVASESLDFHKSSGKNVTTSRGHVDQLLRPSIVDDAELPIEIPPPGAGFWPPGYCYDPLRWFVRYLKVRIGKFAEIFWDRHGGHWMGLRWRETHTALPSLDNVSASELVNFSPERLDGLVEHRGAIDTARVHLYRIPTTSFVKTLSAAAGLYIESLEVKHQPSQQPDCSGKASISHEPFKVKKKKMQQTSNRKSKLSSKG